MLKVVPESSGALLPEKAGFLVILQTKLGQLKCTSSAIQYSLALVASLLYFVVPVTYFQSIKNAVVCDFNASADAVKVSRWMQMNYSQRHKSSKMGQKAVSLEVH